MRPLIGMLAIALASPVLAQLSLPPPMPPSVPPPPIPAPPAVLSTAPIQAKGSPKPVVQPQTTPSAPGSMHGLALPPLALRDEGGAAVAQSKPFVIAVPPPLAPAMPAPALSPFASSETLQAQRKPCATLKFATEQWRQPFGSSEIVAKALTPAKTNCLVAAQPSESWVGATMIGGNAIRLSLQGNNTPDVRTAVVRVATPQASFELAVEQAANPAEFLPLE